MAFTYGMTSPIGPGVVAHLAPKADGWYVDGTVGLGGHKAELLDAEAVQHLARGRELEERRRIGDALKPADGHGISAAGGAVDDGRFGLGKRRIDHRLARKVGPVDAEVGHRIERRRT